VLVALAMCAGPAVGQRLGTVEASLFGRGTLFDASFQRTGIALGFGGRIGAYLGPQWQLEVDYSSSAPERLRYKRLHVHLNYVAEFQPGGFMVAGLGYVRDK
jgi:hypothetical protein